MSRLASNIPGRQLEITIPQSFQCSFGMTGVSPVEQPTPIELTLNRKTAKALGITFPPSLLLADKVIE